MLVIGKLHTGTLVRGNSAPVSVRCTRCYTCTCPSIHTNRVRFQVQQADTVPVPFRSNETRFKELAPRSSSVCPVNPCTGTKK